MLRKIFKIESNIHILLQEDLNFDDSKSERFHYEQPCNNGKSVSKKYAMHACVSAYFYDLNF